jgi:hypothetical protein
VNEVFNAYGKGLDGCGMFMLIVLTLLLTPYIVIGLVALARHLSQWWKNR